MASTAQEPDLKNFRRSDLLYSTRVEGREGADVRTVLVPLIRYDWLNLSIPFFFLVLPGSLLRFVNVGTRPPETCRRREIRFRLSCDGGFLALRASAPIEERTPKGTRIVPQLEPRLMM